MEGRRNNTSGSMSRPHTYVGKYTIEDECIELYGIFERKEQFDDIRAMERPKVQYKNREFWCKGYYVDTTGKDAVKIKEYIENQLMGEQLGFIDKIDPFTGSRD